MKIAIIGGGISGITTAIHLANEIPKCEIVVFEKKKEILSGSPYCHLHAGGFLYPDISFQDAQILLEQSLLFSMYFPNSIIHRPTIIAYNKNSPYVPKQLLHKSNLIKYQYTTWVHKYNIYPLGSPEQFYASYTLDDYTYFKLHHKLPYTDEINRQYHDPYVENFFKLLHNPDDIKFPFISICEFGIDQENVVNQLKSEVKISTRYS